MATRARTAADEDLDDFPELSPEDLDELERRWDENRRAVARGGRPSARSEHNTAPADASTGSMRRPGPASGSSRAWSFDAADDGAGLILGLFVYALGVNYLRGGWPGVKLWLRAKFLNDAPGFAYEPSAPGGVGAPDPDGPGGMAPGYGIQGPGGNVVPPSSGRP